MTLKENLNAKGDTVHCVKPDAALRKTDAQRTIDGGQCPLAKNRGAKENENLQENIKTRGTSSAGHVPGVSADSQSNALVFSALPSGCGGKRSLRQGCPPRSEE